MPPLGIPSFFQQSSVILLGTIFLFVMHYEFCLERLVWYESLLCLLVCRNHLRWTHLSWESLTLLKFARIALCASLKSFEHACENFEEINSLASLIYFWELLMKILKKLILMLHLNLFENFLLKFEGNLFPYFT